MTTAAISRKQQQAQVPYEAAKQIRALLDEARNAYGAQDWDDEGIEERVLELVTEE